MRPLEGGEGRWAKSDRASVAFNHESMRELSMVGVGSIKEYGPFLADDLELGVPALSYVHETSVRRVARQLGSKSSSTRSAPDLPLASLKARPAFS